jgi:hypothetical protein
MGRARAATASVVMMVLVAAPAKADFFTQPAGPCL